MDSNHSAGPLFYEHEEPSISENPLLEASFRPDRRFDLTLSLNSNKNIPSEVHESELLENSSSYMREQYQSSEEFSSSIKDMKPWQLQLMLNHQHSKLIESQQRNVQLESEVDDLLRRNAILKRDFANAQSAYETQIAKLTSENSELSEKFQQFQSKIKEPTHFTIQKLKEGNAKLHEKCENLTLELNSRPTQKQYKETLNKLREIGKKRARSATPGNHNHNRHSLVLQHAMRILKVDNSENFLTTLALVAQKYKLIDKLELLVKECSPPDAFHPKPTHKQIWKWVRRIMEDLLRLRKHVEREDKAKSIVKRIQGALGVASLDEVHEQLLRVIASEHTLRDLVKKAKFYFKVETNEQLENLLK